MRRAPITSPVLRSLVERAAARPMTEMQRERQIVSLAYGNAKLENDRVTRPVVARAVRDTRHR